MTIKTEILEAIKLHCKAKEKDKQIEEYFQDNLTSQKHLKPQVHISRRVSETNWSYVIHIQYTSLNIYDIETVYSIVSRIKELLPDESYKLTSKDSDNGLSLQIILDGDSL